MCLPGWEEPVRQSRTKQNDEMGEHDWSVCPRCRRRAEPGSVAGKQFYGGRGRIEWSAEQLASWRRRRSEVLVKKDLWEWGAVWQPAHRCQWCRMVWFAY